MVKIAQDISDFFTFVVDLFKTFFELIFAIINVLGRCLIFIVDITTAVPAWLAIPVGVLVTVAVLYKILGRESQS